MAINTRTVMDEGLADILDYYFGGGNTIIILINDLSGTLDDTSTITQVVNQEISSAGGYTRKTLTFPSATINNSFTAAAETTSNTVTWTATGAAIDTFTHAALIIRGNSAIGDTTGVINRVEPVLNGSVISTGLSLPQGASYSYNTLKRALGEYV